MKKFMSIIIGLAMLVAVTGCQSNPAASQTTAAATTAQPASNFDLSSEITVISREEGSGTRGAFIELLGVEVKDASGNKVDMTTEEASITNNTSVMMTSVAGNPYAIGYCSLGSLNDTVKAVNIEGIAPTVENIVNGTYTVARPFNIATKGEVSKLAQDFIAYIMSTEGQAVIEENGYIPNANTTAFAANGATGKIVVAGSSSVTPVMEKLKEAYLGLNSGAEIEIQQSDSTTGMTSAIDGICDIGMASRELKDSELEAGLTATVIATDGIVVIANNENPIEGLTKEQVRQIYTGEVTTWQEVSAN